MISSISFKAEPRYKGPYDLNKGDMYSVTNLPGIDGNYPGKLVLASHYDLVLGHDRENKLIYATEIPIKMYQYGDKPKFVDMAPPHITSMFKQQPQEPAA
jgi:hypothetical protein